MNIRAVTMSTFSLSSRLVGGVFSMSMLFMAARGVGLVAGFGAQILLARMLAPEGLGIFYFATSIAYVAGMAAAFGYPVIAVRFISRYRTRGNDMLKSAFVNRAQSDTAIVSFTVMAVVLVLTAIIPGDSATRLAIGAAALAIPALALSRIYGSVAGAIREFALSYTLNLLWRPLLFLAVMGLIGLVFALPSPLMAACAFSFVSVAIVTLQFAGLVKHFPGLAGSATPADRRVMFQWRVASAPLLILAAFSTMINDLNLALLGTIVSKSDLAVFGVCLKLALIVEYAVSLIHELAAPDISDALVRKQRSAVDIAIARINFMAMAATLAAVVGVVVFGRFVLSMFGPDFVLAFPILLTLVVSQFIRAAFGPAVLTLISAGAQKSVVVVFSIAIVGFALSNLVLVPMFGLAGAAAAFAVMTGFWTISLTYVLKRDVGLRVDSFASFGVLRRQPLSMAGFMGGGKTTDAQPPGL